MHERSPSPDNSNDDELFGQLADLGMEDINKTIGYELESIALKQESIQRQQQVIQQLRGRHTILTELLEPFTEDTKFEIYDAVTELRNFAFKNSLSPEVADRINLMDAVYSHVWKIAAILSKFGDKTESQVAIITDNILPPELKTIFLEVLHKMVPDGGIDTTNPDEVQQAINRWQAHEQDTERTKAIRTMAMNLLRIHEYDLLRQYNIHVEDPVWREIRLWTSTNITLRSTFGKDNHDVFSFGIKDHLATLRIGHTDYLALVARIEDLLEE